MAVPATEPTPKYLHLSCLLYGGPLRHKNSFLLITEQLSYRDSFPDVVEQTREINKHGEEIHLLPVVEKQRGSRRSKVISCAQAKHSATCRESWWE